MSWFNVDYLTTLATVVASVGSSTIAIVKAIGSENKKRKQLIESIFDEIKNLNTRTSNLEVHDLRIELLNAIDKDYDRLVVSDLYDKYRALGGNSYAKHEYEKYSNNKGDNEDD